MSNNKKILLMGKSGSGKSSMRSMIFSNYSAIDTRRLGATIDVERTQIRLLNNLNLSLLDCGGQDAFMMTYIKSPSLLAHAEVLCYVFDYVGTEDNDYRIFDMILNTLKEVSRSCRIFILVHKMDLVEDRMRQLLLNEFIKKIEQRCTNLKYFENVNFNGTSIWDESLYAAWSSIVGALIPETETLKKNLHILAGILNAECILVFESLTFLSITKYPASETLGNLSQKVSAIIKNYRKSIEKVSSRFKSLTLQAYNKTVYLNGLTDNMIIMIVLPDTNGDDDNTFKVSEEKYVQEVIRKARKTFDKLDFSNNNSNSNSSSSVSMQQLQSNNG